MPPVLRFALALVVGLLTFSASGVSALVVDEPCVVEQAGREDRSCAPTCVTCGCCAQATEPAAVPHENAPDEPARDVRPLTPLLPVTDPGDILHVPKPLA